MLAIYTPRCPFRRQLYNDRRAGPHRSTALLRNLPVNKLAAVALHGFVYSNNFGDMLLARIALNIVRRHAPQADLSLPFSAKSFLTSAGINSDTGWVPFLHSNALLYHGGGYFAFSPRYEWRTRLRLFKRFYAPGLAAARIGKPYAIFGVGVGPLHSAAQQRAVRNIFDSASIVTVRDEESYDWLRRIGVSHDRLHSAADLALTLTPNDLPADAIAAADNLLSRAPADQYIGLHLSAPSGMDASYDAIMRGVITFVERYPALGIVVLCDHVAGPAGERTPQYLAGLELVERIGKRAIFVGQPPLWTLVALLARLDGLVTNKLHTGIVSSAFGRRVVSIAKNDKNFRFFRQIDAPSRCIGIAESQFVDIPALLERGFESLHVTNPLPTALRELAGKNDTLIRTFLNGVAAGKD